MRNMATTRSDFLMINRSRRKREKKQHKRGSISIAVNMRRNAFSPLSENTPFFFNSETDEVGNG